MFIVAVEGLEFYGYHGVPDAERELGHRYRADLTAQVDEAAGSSDRIEDTVDYVTLARDLLALSQRRPFKTLEAFAKTYVLESLERHEAIQTLTIKLSKPLPPADIMASAVCVSFTSSRQAG